MQDLGFTTEGAGMSDKRTKWDNRWREKAGHPCEPDGWLLRARDLLPAGKALDVACGQGRNALYLAEQGMSVTAIDLSEEALEQLRNEAAARNLDIRTCRVDLESDPRLPGEGFDLVTIFFYLYRPLLPLLRNAVRPGGIMVMRSLSSAGPFPGGPGNPDFVLHPGELLGIFADWEILLHEEGLEPSRRGGSVAGIVARRPL
jgi:SAM-dependent methyltransferase